MAKSEIPKGLDTVKPLHKMSALPLKLLNSINIGPLGGDNAISVIIETVLAKKRGEEPEYDLSKTERFFVNQLAKTDIPPQVVDYRAISIEAQEELLSRFGHETLGIIWIGAGVFTLAHPLMSKNQDNNWHIWTDSSPRVVHSALKAFSKMQNKNKVAKLSHTIELPQDGPRLNDWIRFLSDHVDRIIVMGYGVNYALTPAENHQWLQAIDQSSLNLPLHFVFNSPAEKIKFLPGLIAAFHNQRMVYYTRDDIERLFRASFPEARIAWEKKRSESDSKVWEAWIIDVQSPS
ncbi:MAG: hypothetical protein AAFN10_24660 [Bacteroidota bacterium]